MSYSKNLSYIHDQGFIATALHAANFLTTHILTTHLPEKINKPLIVDLGCGSGAMAELLIKKGYNILGIDISKEMIAIARKKLPQAKFIVGSYLEVDIPHCKVITAIGECFNYLFDSRVNLKTLQDFFEKCYKALEKGGHFIFDIMENTKEVDFSGQGMLLNPQWAVLVNKLHDKKKGILRRKITSFVKKENSYKRTDETHSVILYKQKEILGILKKVGFKVKIQKSYGKFRLRPGCSVYACSK